jgi:hypothetical protein
MLLLLLAGCSHLQTCPCAAMLLLLHALCLTHNHFCQIKSNLHATAASLAVGSETTHQIVYVLLLLLLLPLLLQHALLEVYAGTHDCMLLLTV